MRPIFSIAKTTLAEAIRRKVLLVILFIGILFLMFAPALGALSVRGERSVLLGLTFGVIQLTGIVISIIMSISLIPDEIERRTIYMILSKPVQRWQFYIGKYLGAILTLGCMVFLMAIVLLGSFAWQQNLGGIGGVIPLLKVPLMYYMQMCLLSAFCLFFSTFVSPTVNFFLSGGIFMIGSLFNPILETIVEGGKTAGILNGLLQIMSSIMPNFANYNVQNPIINPGQQLQNETLYTLNITLYGLFYISVLIIAGMLVFDRREI